MLRYLLDTNFCIRVLRDRPKGLLERFNDNAEALCLSDVVLYELLYDAEKAQNPAKVRREVESFAARLSVLPFDDDAAAHTADIRADLEARGCVIGPYDLMIAGHARSRGLVVVTGNLGEFTRVGGLRSEDWIAGQTVRGLSAAGLEKPEIGQGGPERGPAIIVDKASVCRGRGWLEPGPAGGHGRRPRPDNGELQGPDVAVPARCAQR